MIALDNVGGGVSGSNGGMAFVDKEELARQNGVLRHLVRSIGSNLLEVGGGVAVHENGQSPIWLA